MDVYMKPVEERIRRESVHSSMKDRGGERRDKTDILSPSQESIEELASPSREGPAGAGPVIEVEDKN